MVLLYGSLEGLLLSQEKLPLVKNYLPLQICSKSKIKNWVVEISLPQPQGPLEASRGRSVNKSVG